MIPGPRTALETDPSQPVLLIGTGLTMLDIALALRDARAARPDPRGLAARVAATASPRVLGRPAALSAARRPRRLAPHGSRAAHGACAREVDGAAEAGIDWREVHTSLRADTPALWRSLDQTEKERFLRHARPYWETHRHRSSPQTAAAIEELLSTGRLRVVAGHVLGFEQADDMVDARLRLRGRRESSTVRVGRVVNCTGPDTDLRRVDEPLVQQLLANGLATPDPLGLGLQSGERGELIGGDGRAGERLFLVGPLRKGLLWENTAVPELRIEAERMARHLSSLVTGETATVRRVPRFVPASVTELQRVGIFGSVSGERLARFADEIERVEVATGDSFGSTAATVDVLLSGLARGSSGLLRPGDVADGPAAAVTMCLVARCDRVTLAALTAPSQ